MAACEKCWTDAFHRSREAFGKSQAEHYQKLIEERKDNPCTPKQQAGEYWDEEKQCDKREIDDSIS